MKSSVPHALRELVRRRARFRCEYCLLHEEHSLFPHGLDHIVARKHRGATDESNLAWACIACNKFKGTDLTSVDIETGRVEILFNPRRDRWSQHLRVQNGLIVGLTPKGRVTEYLLRFNLPRSVRARRFLIQLGQYPR